MSLSMLRPWPHVLLCGLALGLTECTATDLPPKPDALRLYMSEKTWTKAAYLRVEKRLHAATTGMEWPAFTKLIDYKVMVRGRKPQQKVLATLADGWIGAQTASWTENGVESSEYWFGFVEKEKLIKKAVVRFDRDQLVGVRYFEETIWSDLPPQERRETRVENLDKFLYTPESYAKAEARAPKLKEGMDRHEFEEIMEVSCFYIGNGLFWAAAPGMLNELYKPPTEDKNNMPGTFYFGYRKDKTAVPKLLIEFCHNRVVRIQWLDAHTP